MSSLVHQADETCENYSSSQVFCENTATFLTFKPKNIVLSKKCPTNNVKMCNKSSFNWNSFHLLSLKSSESLCWHEKLLNLSMVISHHECLYHSIPSSSLWIAHIITIKKSFIVIDAILWAWSLLFQLFFWCIFLLFKHKYPSFLFLGASLLTSACMRMIQMSWWSQLFTLKLQTVINLPKNLSFKWNS